ncbi:FAD-binding oxidoreductase [Nereida sp. MMG025]|uniref:FAD-binding oxidoreductase n=1 Tax=Nereida sp. MMG025 TaxID=2909981 RepID=UPI001F1ADA6A|nr:FAD-binding oxidoreductase [Nereida sp. MMG025]MCF6445045.1 FAD-binding oxidoreductase [Nereida sp. MMG025]
MTYLAPASADFEATARAILPPDTFAEVGAQYLEEPRGRYAGSAGLLAKPRTTEEVSKLVKLAHDHGVAVIPYGGGTGLVGGQVAEDGPAPLILSLERMTALRAVYPSENAMVVEAGMILADVQSNAAAYDRIFPLSLASEGSARIGGVLSTNAGGVNVLRYGNARDLCLGLEVVLADGTIWNGLTRLRKNNTGYDLRHLMIGAEGTLGIITAAALKLHPVPASEGTAFMTVKNPKAALDLLALAQSHMGGGVSAFEIIHRQSFDFLTETLPDIRHPFAQTPEWCVLTEVGLPAGMAPDGALEGLFRQAVDAGLADDGVIASSLAQRQAFWSVREHIPEANRRIGSVSSHDISVPLSAIPEFIERANAAIASLGDFRINCFGHVGDGNLHYNVFPVPGKTRADHMQDRDMIKKTVHDLVHDMGGSVSAEHGIGRLKVDDMERYSDPAKLAMMRSIKDALDPKGILNPGAVIRPLR